MAEGLEALLRSAQAALSAASATLPSAEERRAEAAAAESLAVSGAGAVAKTAVGCQSFFQSYSTLVVFTSVTHSSPSLTASLAILVPKRSPFYEISISQKSASATRHTTSTLTRPHSSVPQIR